MLAELGPILPLCWPYRSYVGLSWPYLAPMLTLCSPMLALEMLTPIAVTEKAEVGTGWGGGGNGVTTGSPDQVGGWGGTPL